MSAASASWSLIMWAYTRSVIEGSAAAESGRDNMHGDACWQTVDGRGIDVAQIVGAPPLGTYSQLLHGLALAVIPEHLRGFGVNADGAGPATLGRSLDALPRNDGGRIRDADLPEVQVQVDVPPPEVEQFAPPSTCVRGAMVEGEQRHIRRYAPGHAG